MQSCMVCFIFLTFFVYALRSVFVHRCRDVEAIIRTECIKHLGEWMEQYPSYFLDNNYLRYIGWLLNDKVSLFVTILIGVPRGFTQHVLEKCISQTMSVRNQSEASFHCMIEKPMQPIWSPSCSDSKPE